MITRQNGTLYLVFTLVAATALMAAYFYYFRSSPAPSIHSRNIQQHMARPFPASALLPSQQHFLHSLKGKWTLALITPKHCQLTCQRYENSLARIIRATNNDSRRLQRVTMIIGVNMNEPLERFKLYLVNQKPLAPIFKQAVTHARLLILNPQTDVVMHYNNLSHTDHILQDIKHLLRQSN